MSSDVTGRRTAASRTAHARTEGATASGSTSPCVDAPAEVLEFIRYCYRRRRIGWPELYDEMCAVAARGSYRGMDYDALAALGIGFSLKELPRLAALSQRIVAEERLTRSGSPANGAVAPIGSASGAPVRGAPDAGADAVTHPTADEAGRVRAAMITAAAG